MSCSRAAWAPAALVLAAFAVSGHSRLDDYGVAGDEFTQRLIGQQAFNYARGEPGGPPANLKESDRYYGVAKEAPSVHDRAGAVG